MINCHGAVESHRLAHGTRTCKILVLCCLSRKLVLMCVVLLHAIHPALSQEVVPSGVTRGVVGGNASFVCVNFGVAEVFLQWAINQNSTHDFPDNARVIVHDNELVALDFLSLTPENNATKISCVSYYKDSGLQRSASNEVKLLVVLGYLGHVGSLQVTEQNKATLLITWAPPTVMGVLDHDPSMTSYCVGLFNASLQSEVVLQCEINVTMFVYHLPPRSWCQLFFFSVTPQNTILGSGLSKLLAYSTTDTRPQAVSMMTLAGLVVLQMSAPVCHVQLTLVDIDTGETITLGDTNVIITAETDITFATELLNKTCNYYNVSIIASNSAGSATSKAVCTVMELETTESSSGQRTVIISITVIVVVFVVLSTLIIVILVVFWRHAMRTKSPKEADIEIPERNSSSVDENNEACSTDAGDKNNEARCTDAGDENNEARSTDAGDKSAVLCHDVLQPVKPYQPGKNQNYRIQSESRSLSQRNNAVGVHDSLEIGVENTETLGMLEPTMESTQSMEIQKPECTVDGAFSPSAILEIASYLVIQEHSMEEKPELAVRSSFSKEVKLEHAVEVSCLPIPATATEGALVSELAVSSLSVPAWEDVIKVHAVKKTFSLVPAIEGPPSMEVLASMPSVSAREDVIKVHALRNSFSGEVTPEHAVEISCLSIPMAATKGAPASELAVSSLSVPAWEDVIKVHVLKKPFSLPILVPAIEDAPSMKILASVSSVKSFSSHSQPVGKDVILDHAAEKPSSLPIVPAIECFECTTSVEILASLSAVKRFSSLSAPVINAEENPEILEHNWKTLKHGVQSVPMNLPQCDMKSTSLKVPIEETGVQRLYYPMNLPQCDMKSASLIVFIEETRAQRLYDPIVMLKPPTISLKMQKHCVGSIPCLIESTTSLSRC